MDDNQEKDTLLRDMREQLAPILNGSTQGVYVYLGEAHRFCNTYFAKLLGYASSDEWAEARGDFTDLFVESGSVDALVGSYRAAKEKFEGASGKVTWKKKGGGMVATNVILVPITLRGQVFALHYITAA